MPRRPRPPSPPRKPSALKLTRHSTSIPVPNVTPISLVEEKPGPDPAPDTRLLDHLRNEISMLKAKASRLENELKDSRLHAKFVEESILEIRKEEHDRAREQGHGEVLSEVEALWRSEHFCTELLYGIIKFKFI